MTLRPMFIRILVLLLSFATFCPSTAQKLHVNDLGYFEARGLNVLVFNSEYNGFFFDEKTSGIEIIHHGVRTATGGAVRLSATPEQWDQIPVMTSRQVDTKGNSIEVSLRYKDYDFDSEVTVTALDDGVMIRVLLDKPLPEKLIGKAGFNLEFLPSAYFEKSYFVDGRPSTFPLYPSSDMRVAPLSQKIPQFNGYSTFDDRGKGEFLIPQPLASGKTIILAPEDPERYVRIRSSKEDLMLFDGRNLAQNGWFVVRSLIPAHKTGTVLEWYVEPETIANWTRKPVIEFSQVGYHPSQNKVAVIELDTNDPPLKEASLFQVTADGSRIERLRSDVKLWGKYLRYNYVTFDFSSVKDSGLYVIRYGNQQTDAFPIGTHVFDDIWHLTLDVWFPVQMDHMFVREAYRIWHGVPFRDDALQAPVGIRHFDGYWMDSTTNTKYKPLEHIPGLDVGGWFDAGDFDIETGHHNSTILRMVDTWELFGLKRDETSIDERERYVDIHHPDGKPDLLQQIEHGTLQLVAQHKNIGFAVRGINFPNLYQYHHLGDASTITDNLPYNPKLKPYQSDGLTSGTMDDRWVFTPRLPSVNLGSIAALAAASRALRDFNAPLSKEALDVAVKAWNEEHERTEPSDTGRNAIFMDIAEASAALQLLITTKDDRYATRLNEIIWKGLDNDQLFPMMMSVAVRAVQHMGEPFKSRLRAYAVRYAEQGERLNGQNPYGLPIGTRGWGGNYELINWSITNYFLNKNYPDIIGNECVIQGLDYVLGCHPYSNLSFVAGVGTRSKKVMYGSNRADFSFIAGGVVPGLLFLKPDFLENKEDWPFLWGENEAVIDICADYIFLANAVEELVEDRK